MKNVQIDIEATLRKAVPELVLGDILCTVRNSKYNEELWSLVKQYEADLRKRMKIDAVKDIPAIQATRLAYKACGKDPNRYRPSAEQLNRRILQGKELYQISTVVDLINLVSLKTGYSIGGFDYNKIEGPLSYGIGRVGEPYEGIGRGNLNIEGTPVLRDKIGGIGTPTSDEMRTRICENSSVILININAFDGNRTFLNETMAWTESLLKHFLNAEIHKITVFC